MGLASSGDGKTKTLISLKGATWQSTQLGCSWNLPGSRRAEIGHYCGWGAPQQGPYQASRLCCYHTSSLSVALCLPMEPRDQEPVWSEQGVRHQRQEVTSLRDSPEAVFTPGKPVLEHLWGESPKEQLVLFIHLPLHRQGLFPWPNRHTPFIPFFSFWIWNSWVSREGIVVCPSTSQAVTFKEFSSPLRIRS